MELGTSRVHVVPSLSGGWVVRETADGPSLRRTNTRRGALRFANELLYRGHGGEVELHEADGTVIESHQVFARGQRPWWFSPPRIGLLIAGIAFMIEGAIDIGEYSRFMYWLGWILSVTGALQVVSFVVSTRSDRSARLEARRSPTE